MALKIIWSKRADKKFDKIIDYLNESFGESVTKSFVRKVYDFLDILSEFPELGSIENRERGIRGFTIVKNINVFYRIELTIDRILRRKPFNYIPQSTIHCILKYSGICFHLTAYVKLCISCSNGSGIFIDSYIISFSQTGVRVILALFVSLLKISEMTTKQLKTEIHRLLDRVPDTVLQDLIDYLREAQKQTREQAELSSYLKKIIHEDKELLEKLAK